MIKKTKRAIIFVIGVTIIAFGMVLIFLPGPAIIVIPIGLFVLASEFTWARRLLRAGKKAVSHNGENQSS